MNTEQRLDFIRKGMGVRRYHQRHTAVEDTVGKHSAGVAMFLILIYGDKLPRAELLAAALCHDLPEWVVGDIPSPAKKAMSPSARQQLSTLEESLLVEYSLQYDLTQEEDYYLKVSDCFDGLMFCTEEVIRGNREVQDVGEKYLSYLSNLITGGTPQVTIIFNILHMKWLRAIQ